MSQLGFSSLKRALPTFRGAIAGWTLASCVACAGAPPAAEGPLSAAAGRGDDVSAEQLLRAGERLAQKGDSVRAEHYLVAALERGAAPEQVVPLLVTVCLDGSRLRTALDHAEPYLRAHPTNTELRFLVATIYLGLGRAEAARGSLEEVLRLRPRHGGARYVLASLLAHQLGEADAAEDHFTRYLELEPGGAHAAEVRSWLGARRRAQRSAAPEEDRT